ncbi:NCA2 family protein [Aspergillus lucknowensis]|uniref:ATP synthase regulation protein NCA2-domain-containing protein n=1 Tax=Aspergillus lucknowensis TaxID=176173 RepID=A0ABR4LTV7_9EURO
MSVLKSKVYRLETQLGEIHQHINDRADLTCAPVEHITALENLISKLAISSRNIAVLRNDQLVDVITASRNDLRFAADSSLELDKPASHLSNLSWLVSAKASAQTLATILTVFSEHVHLLNEEIRYWEDVLYFDWWVGLYTLQTAPFNVWRRYNEAGRCDKSHTRGHPTNHLTIRPCSHPNIYYGFWATVQRCVSPELYSVRVGLSSSLRGSKLEIQRRKRKLRAMRDFSASAVGILVEECLSLGTESSGFSSNSLPQTVQSTVRLMKSLLQNTGGVERLLPGNVAASGTPVDPDVKCVAGSEVPEAPQDVLEELLCILTELVPKYKHLTAAGIDEFGRPSPAVRYWLPFSLTLISATTTLKIGREVGPVLVDLLSNLGHTTVEFWRNWVLDPTWKLVRTIRHDEKSEIALISKNSLEADRASLERMVVDFVLDRGEQAQPFPSADMVMEKVKEGDLTPVLRVYEKDLRSPFIGTLRGDLVRALLIQIQKTKVDVEIAMSGIDALLKSQELVFGFVGLTPGLLISYASIRWFLGLLSSRRGFRLGRRQDDFRYALRNIHRIISTSVPMTDGRLPYKTRGLLICNADVLLTKAQGMLKGVDVRAFQEDISDLVDQNLADKQLRIIDRIAWAYSKWIS